MIISFLLTVGARFLVVALVVFFANAALLILQLTAGRLLAPVIGSSLATWTAVIGMFLAGISAGNWYGGKLADRAATGRMLGFLLGQGSFTLLVSLAIAKLLGNVLSLHWLPLHPRIAITSFLVCFPAAFVLSRTTPVAIKLVLPDVRQTGRVVGIIYALGTLGSLVGNFLTGFYFMAVFSISTLVVGTAALLLLLGVIVSPVSPVHIATKGEALDAPVIDVAELLSLPTACAIVFMASFCSMALELTASRLLAPYIGVSIFSWTGIIGVVLAGIVIGNSLGGWIADRWPRRDTLGSSLFWCGLFSLLILVLFAIGTKYQQNVDDWLKAQVAAENYLPTQIVMYAAALFFLPMVAFGTISPQATRLAVSDWAHAGRVAGRVYAWSCAGAIAGTFATGWLLIGAFGSLSVVITIAGLMILMSLPVGSTWRKPVELFGAGFVLAAIGLVIWTGRDQFLSMVKNDYKVYARETNYYLVLITKKDFDDTQREFILDHLIHSHVYGQWVGDRWQADVTQMGYGHEQVQSEFARAAADAHEHPKMLVIGGGGYTLPRWIDHTLPQASVEVVEIDPGVTRAVYDALGLDRDTKIKTHNLDGRQFIQESAVPDSYHLIIQDAVNDLSVPWHIMTKEYDDAVRKALAPDGVYLLTVIDEYPEGKLLAAAIETMQASFPHVYLLGDLVKEKPVWATQSRSVFVIAGTLAPLDLSKLQSVLKKNDIEEMKTVVMPAEELEAYLKKAHAPMLTDEFAPVDNLIAETFRRR